MIAVGAGLRLYNLDFQSLWYDELHSIIPTASENSFSSIIEYCKTDQPPAYFLFLHYAFKVLPYDAIGARLLSVFLGILSIPVLFLLGREFGNERSGLCAALLTTVNYFHIYYSQEARFYSMAFLFSALSYLFFIRAFKHRKPVDFRFYVICTAILLYTHYYGLVIFAVQSISFLLLVIFYDRNRRLLIWGLASGIIIAVCFIPWMKVITSELGVSTFWTKSPTVFFLPEYFYNYFGKDILVTVILVFFSFLFFKSWLAAVETDADKRLLYIILLQWLFFSYLIPFVKSLIGVPVLHIRYTIITLPAWIILFSIGWGVIKYQKLKYILIFCISLSSIVNLVLIRKHYTKVQKQQFREASQLVISKNTLRYPVCSEFAWHYNFYFRDSPVQVNAFQATDLSKVDRFWLLQAEFFSPSEKDEELKKYNENFEAAEYYTFYKTRAVLMIKK